MVIISESAKEILSKLVDERGKLGRNMPAIRHFEKFKSSLYQGKNLTVKEKTLIALAIAVVKQCKYCIAIHLNDCVNEGATDEEIFEACGIAVLMEGGPAVAYSTFVQEALRELRA